MTITFQQAMDAYDRGNRHSEGVQNILDAVRTAAPSSEPASTARVASRNQHYTLATKIMSRFAELVDDELSPEGDPHEGDLLSRADRDLLRIAQVHALLAGVPARVAGE